MPYFDYESLEEGYYDKIYHRNAGIQSKWHHLKFLAIHYFLSSLSYKSILDLGCGPGTFTATLPKGRAVYGLDMAQRQIAYAQKRYGHAGRFIVGSATKIPFPDESLDLIISIEFIEHLTAENVGQMLKEVYRCLKRQGHFILTTPNYRSLWPVLERIVYKITGMNYAQQHLTHFTPRRLRQVLLSQDFEIVELRPYLFLSPFGAMIHWDWANRAFDFEFRHLKSLGNLLLAHCRKG